MCVPPAIGCAIHITLTTPISPKRCHHVARRHWVVQCAPAKRGRLHTISTSTRSREGCVRANPWTDSDVDTRWDQLQLSNPSTRIGSQTIKFHIRSEGESQCPTRHTSCTKCLLLTHVTCAQQTATAFLSAIIVRHQPRRPWPAIDRPEDIIFQHLWQCSLGASNELCAWRNDASKPVLGT